MESCLICGPSSKLINKKCNQCNQVYDPQKIDIPDNISKFTKSVNNFFFTIEDAQSLNGFLDYTSKLRKNLNISYDVSKQAYNWFDNEIKKIQLFSNFTIKVQSEYTPQNIQKKIFQLNFSIHNTSPKELYSFSVNFSDEHQVITPNFIKPNQQINLISELNYSNFGQINFNDLSLNIKNQFEEQQKFIIETFKIIVLKPKPINLAENADQDLQIQYHDLILFPVVNLEELNKSIAPSNLQSEGETQDSEIVSSDEPNDSDVQPQPFYANEYSSNKSVNSKKNEKPINNKKSSSKIKKIFSFLIVLLAIFGGIYVHDYNNPCDSLVFKDDWACRAFGSCPQIYDKFSECMTSASASFCTKKWGKTMFNDDFNIMTDITGATVDSNNKYRVRGKNYSSRWIYGDWWYFNKSLDLDSVYGTDFIAGPTGSSSDYVEVYADLSYLIGINSNDDDGWNGNWKYVETACYNPLPKTL